MRTIDLRSDTVTVPNEAMRRAMADAEVGDDVYGEDPTVARLEADLAERVGMEAGLFFPTGTMTNQAAIAAHVGRGFEVIVPEGAHVYEFELGAMSALSGLTPRPIPAPAGVPDPADLRAAVHRSKHQAPTGLVVLENTHNRAGGTILSVDRQAELIAAARAEGLPVHLDGARAFNAAVAQGISIAEVCAGFDSVSICLSKGLGAPVGSVLLGPRELVDRAHRYRKMFGGGMRQAGVLAAAGLYALRTQVDDLTLDHERARALARGVADLPGVAVDLATVQTNMVYLRVEGAQALVRDLAAEGLLANALAHDAVRLVTHRDLADGDVDAALGILSDRLARRHAA